MGIEAIIIIITAAVVILIGLWLFLIGARHDKRMDEYKRVKYAHRGLHGCPWDLPYAAENSLTAFGRAADAGFGIELDVRVTKDGELIVFHDDDLVRVTGKEGKVIDFTYEELSDLRLLGTEDGIPTFRQVLDLVGGRVPLLVEIKESGTDQSASRKTVQMLSDYDGKYIVESFNPLSLGAVKRGDAKILRGFLCDKLTSNSKMRSLKYRVIQRHLLNFIARPHFIASSFKRYRMFPIPLIRLLFRPAFIAWTVRSAEEEREAYKRGFDGVIFENYIPD